MARRRRRSKKWISWLIILILLFAAVVVVYLVWENYFKDEGNSPSKEPEVIQVEKDEDEQNSDEAEEVKTEEKEIVKQYEGEDPNSNTELTGVVTYAGVVGNRLSIRVNINQYLSGGICKLRLVFEGDIAAYSDEASIVSSASTSTCEGFDIPLSKLSSGEYDIYIDLDANGKKGVITGEVNI